jgi:hypothetical protein
VAGGPAAVTDAEQIVIENTARTETFRKTVADDGSFVLDVEWADGEALECWAERAPDEKSARVTLLLPDPDPFPPPPSVPLDVDSVSAPDAAGTSTVAGSVNEPATVVVANRDTGAAASTFVDGPSDFSLIIAASAGDRLVVFAVSPESRKRIGLKEVSVPGP